MCMVGCCCQPKLWFAEPDEPKTDVPVPGFQGGKLMDPAPPLDEDNIDLQKKGLLLALPAACLTDDAMQKLLRCTGCK